MGPKAFASVDAMLNNARRIHQSGDLDAAERLYHEILQINPNCADAIHLMGLIAHQRGRHDAAIDLISKAIALNGQVASYHTNLGIALFAQARFAEAVDAHIGALCLRPDHIQAAYNLGNGLKAQGFLAQAVSAYSYTLYLDPGFAEAHSNLGTALFDLGRVDDALASYKIALSLKPDHTEAYFNLGSALYHLGQIGVSIPPFHAARLLKPSYAEAHYFESLSHLLLGDFARGLSLYEWRWQANPGITARFFEQPQWRGEDIAGKTILLHAEQGLGDCIQFCRYLPMVAARGGRILFEAQPALQRLLEHLPGIARFIPAGAPLPEFDVHCPLMSLPHLFGTRIDTIPAQIPYLRADPNRIFILRDLLRGSGLHIGIVWQGNPAHKNDRLRSIGLSAFLPLFGVQGLQFHCLQKETSDSDQTLAGQIQNLTLHVKDFADTAALVCGLDLVISIDTSLAHLAGALGRPVWILLTDPPDWRWMLHRTDSPWYPSARLWRQDETRTWSPVIEAIRNELSLLVDAKVKAGAVD